MYAPQWIDIIEECLGYSGLKSGCYYFMAHMNENFDEQESRDDSEIYAAFQRGVKRRML